ncbi:MAG: hypothetical protein EAX90_11145 [Candidatus Heimdallarchaeota archaeon]|nr:hypothetical protein [Candidatus Heimdallarchaeota archaeon]
MMTLQKQLITPIKSLDCLKDGEERIFCFLVSNYTHEELGREWGYGCTRACDIYFKSNVTIILENL